MQLRMNISIRSYFIPALTFVTVLLSGTVCGQDNIRRYEPYTRKAVSQNLYSLLIHTDSITVVTYVEGTRVESVYELDDLRLEDGAAYARDSVLFDTAGFSHNGQSFSFDTLTSISVREIDETLTVTFSTRTGTQQRVNRIKAGNRLSYDGDIVVPFQTFVRGAIFSIAGDITIDGEVNRDVVTIFGDIHINETASLRDDALSVKGSVHPTKEATIYGEMYEGSRQVMYQSRRLTTDWSWIEDFNYNRVDGASIYAGLRYQDPDSLLPTVWAKSGYAFESERWRWALGVAQTISRTLPFAVGAKYYRRLASEDDWLLGNRENTVFALLATEDFKDYFETEGVTIYVDIKPATNLEVSAGYRFDETNWLRANQGMWSLFGGSKQFDPNYDVTDSTLRADGISRIDTSSNGSMYLHTDYDTRDNDDPFGRSGWHLSGDFEWSHPDFGSDFDYRRYSLIARRYQTVTQRTMFILRAMFGNSDEFLPLHKRFYLGGLGTLRGYSHKEFFGTRFWMTNAEYRVALPVPEYLALSVFWDVAQLANDEALDSEVEVKHNLGVGVYLGDDFRINFSKRLDRSFENQFKVYVRLSHVF